ncbi:MAG: class I SAM-dependent methyltransferase [Candidatus Omnitrophota bacterium]|nr:class I SAM-dependent methyltransferase [Candidatus Omnitrophota bacterium]
MLKKIETRIIPEETDRSFYLQHLKVYSFIKDNVLGKSVLDVGCGDGYGCAFLAERAKFVQGVDYESEVVLSAQKKYKADNLKYLAMDALKLEFKNQEFDIVCSFQVIEHIPEELIPVYLNQLRRVLKDKGTLYLSTLNLDKVMKSPKTYKKNLAHCKEFRLEELRETLLRVFKEVTIYGLHLSPRHYFYLRLKKSGIFKFLPDGINPVKRFYKIININDFRLTRSNLKVASDFVCVCKN